MNRKVAEYMWLDTNLRRGLDEGQLTLCYQPKITLASGTVQSVEALVRWNSPERGQIMPGEFIRYAEESGLIGALVSGSCARPRTRPRSGRSAA